MKSLRYLILLALLGLPNLVFGEPIRDELPGRKITDDMKPHEIIRALRDKMYAIGETSGNVHNMNAAQELAVNAVMKFVDTTDNAALNEVDRNGQTPLISASWNGYDNVVKALLKNSDVRHSLEITDKDHVSAWIAANFAYRQSALGCNPDLLSEPFAFVPLMVTMPFYSDRSQARYVSIRKSLEEAGAKPQLASAKNLWIGNCKNANTELVGQIQRSEDLISTLSRVNEHIFTAMMTTNRGRKPRRSTTRTPKPIPTL